MATSALLPTPDQGVRIISKSTEQPFTSTGRVIAQSEKEGIVLLIPQDVDRALLQPDVAVQLEYFRGRTMCRLETKIAGVDGTHEADQQASWDLPSEWKPKGLRAFLSSRSSKIKFSEQKQFLRLVLRPPQSLSSLTPRAAPRVETVIPAAWVEVPSSKPPQSMKQLEKLRQQLENNGNRATIRSLSLTGARLENVPRELPLNKHLWLRFVRDGLSIETLARVAWTEKDAAGVAFVDPDDNLKEIVERVLALSR